MSYSDVFLQPPSRMTWVISWRSGFTILSVLRNVQYRLCRGRNRRLARDELRDNGVVSAIALQSVLLKPRKGIVVLGGLQPSRPPWPALALQ